MPDSDPTRNVSPSIPTLRDLLMVLFRRRRTFVWVAGLVFAVALLYALGGTKYQANMKILVRRGRAETPVSVAVSAPLDLFLYSLIWRSSSASSKGCSFSLACLYSSGIGTCS